VTCSLSERTLKLVNNSSKGRFSPSVLINITASKCLEITQEMFAIAVDRSATGLSSALFRGISPGILATSAIRPVTELLNVPVEGIEMFPH